jgi:hypothetical protein
MRNEITTSSIDAELPECASKAKMLHFRLFINVPNKASDFGYGSPRMKHYPRLAVGFLHRHDTSCARERAFMKNLITGALVLASVTIASQAFCEELNSNRVRGSKPRLHSACRAAPAFPIVMCSVPMQDDGSSRARP